MLNPNLACRLIRKKIFKMVRKITNPIILFLLKRIYFLWRKTNRHANTRLWSNDELKRFAAFFVGDIINVSGGNDADKEGGSYRNYFLKSNSYISNYKKANNNQYEEIELDLDKLLPEDSNLKNRFDVVFSHAVLEHVYNIKTAAANLCMLSKDIIITVVPFPQAFHHMEKTDGTASYQDYWRISPFAIMRLFEEQGFKTICINWSHDPIGNIYIFHIASKNSEKWLQIKALQQVLDKTPAPGYERQLLLSNTNFCEQAILERPS